MRLMIISQAACGPGHKPKGHVEDVDAADVHNELAGVVYLDDLFKHYKSEEVII